MMTLLFILTNLLVILLVISIYIFPIKTFYFDEEKLEYKLLTSNILKTEFKKRYFSLSSTPVILLLLVIVNSYYFYNLGFNEANDINKHKVVEITHSIKHSEFSEELLIKEIENNCKNQKIVLAQAKLESGYFTSNIFQENNNLFGMKFAQSRTTIATKENKGYAYYNSWEDCVKDYGSWQNAVIRYKTMTDEEYLKLLAAIYAEDSTYVEKLKKLM